MCSSSNSVSQSKNTKVVPLDNSTTNNLPISSTLSPSLAQSAISCSKTTQGKKLSGTPSKPKRKRTKGHTERLSTRLQLQQMQQTSAVSSFSGSSSASHLVRGVAIHTTAGNTSTTTSTSDSCSGGGGRKASTSSSSTGSCTNLTSQCETSSFTITDTTPGSKSKTTLTTHVASSLEHENKRPSLSSYCSATEDDVSTIT